MKKVILAVLIFISIPSFSQLNKFAEITKEDYPEGYQVMKKRAITEWPGNHEMIVYEINQQCEAFYSLLEKFANPIEGELMLTMQAIHNWTDENFKDETLSCFTNLADDENPINSLLKLKVNWRMAEYEFKKQLSAMNQY